MERRKITFKLYPNAREETTLTDWTGLHCELYNAALEERIDAWRKGRKSISYFDQQNVLPEIKVARPELVDLGSHALQQTLRKLDLAFQAFFRRVKACQKPGFPRFKSRHRFAGFSYPDSTGWALRQHGKRGATIRLRSGKSAMTIRARGRHRFGADVTPNGLTISRRGPYWYASITLRVTEAACARPRTEQQYRGVDFGVFDFATFDDGTTICNPRFLLERLDDLATLQRDRAHKRRGSLRYRRLSRQIARAHEKIANLRRDFLHKESTRLAMTCAVLATEKLQIQNMTRSAKGTVDNPGKRVKQKAGLNREILSVGLATAHRMLAYKVIETGTRLHLANTRRLKPSQRCSGCWGIVPKPLAQRTHACPYCGLVMPRDQNSAKVVLIDAFDVQDTPGTGVAARPRPLPRKRGMQASLTRETPSTPSSDGSRRESSSHTAD